MPAKILKPVWKLLDEAETENTENLITIAELKEKNAELEREILLLRARAIRSSLPERAHPPRNKPGKGYMASTQSSKAKVRASGRSQRQRRHESAKPEPKQQAETGYRNFMSPTASTNAKKSFMTFGNGYYLRRATHVVIQDGEDTNPKWGAEQDSGSWARGDGEWVNHEIGSPAATKIEETAEVTRSTGSKQAAARYNELLDSTRFHCTFRDWDAASYAGIPAGTGQGILREGYSITLESVDQYFDKHFPGLKQKFFPDGAGCLEISRKEVNKGFNGWFRDHRLDLYSDPDFNNHVLRNLDQLVDMRNATYHPHPRTVRQYDKYLAIGHLLTIGLNDEYAAMKTRKLRENIFDHAKQSMKRVECLALTEALPFAHGDVWEAHDERAFIEFLRSPEGRIASLPLAAAPGVFAEAAATWLHKFGPYTFFDGLESPRDTTAVVDR
ncbi:hypothetical protein OQA88_4317 [Cercophora sp. LCS_1]